MKGKFLLLLFALVVLTANARKTNGALDVLRRVCGNTSVPVQLELKKDAGSMYYEYAVKMGCCISKGRTMFPFAGGSMIM